MKYFRKVQLENHLSTTDLCIINTQCFLFLKNELDALISQINFWNKTLHVLDSSSVHHQEIRPDPARKLSTNL